MKADIRFCGESAITVVFKQEISPEVNGEVNFLCRELSRLSLIGISELVPTYAAVTIHFDPLIIETNALFSTIDEILSRFEGDESTKGALVEIPVVYGGEFGPDMNTVVKHTGLTELEIIKRHSGVEYLIYMLGFTPGFPYMGGMDSSIATPRLATPRTLIPAGSVGIAGAQTGVYPISSPGGWQLIGRTPLKLFDVNRDEPFLLAAGQRVRFVPISAEEYERRASDD